MLTARYDGGLAEAQLLVALNIWERLIDSEHSSAATRSMIGLLLDAVLAVYYGILIRRRARNGSTKRLHRCAGRKNAYG